LTIHNPSDRIFKIELLYSVGNQYNGKVHVHRKMTNKDLENLGIKKKVFTLKPFKSKTINNCFPLVFTYSDLSDDRSRTHIVNSPSAYSISVNSNLRSIKLLKVKPKYPGIKKYDIKVDYK